MCIMLYTIREFTITTHGVMEGVDGMCACGYLGSPISNTGITKHNRYSKFGGIVCRHYI